MPSDAKDDSYLSVLNRSMNYVKWVSKATTKTLNIDLQSTGRFQSPITIADFEKLDKELSYFATPISTDYKNFLYEQNGFWISHSEIPYSVCFHGSLPIFSNLDPAYNGQRLGFSHGQNLSGFNSQVKLRLEYDDQENRLFLGEGSGGHLYAYNASEADYPYERLHYMKQERDLPEALQIERKFPNLRLLFEDVITEIGIYIAMNHEQYDTEPRPMMPGLQRYTPANAKHYTV